MRWATTSWMQVLAARDAPSSESRQALEALCQAYWYPVYALVPRRQGFDPEQARDLAQAYFALLLEKGYLQDFDPSRGRFRVFLRASVNHIVSKERGEGQGYGIDRLASRAFDHKRAGYELARSTHKDLRGKRYSRYSIAA